MSDATNAKDAESAPEPKDAGSDLESTGGGTLPADVDEAIEAVIDELPEDRRDSARITLRRTLTWYSGPLPPPEMLEKYAEIEPTAPGVIIDQFRKQGDHRRTMETAYMQGSERRANVGQVLGTIVVLVAVGLGAALGFAGQPVLGGTIVTIALGVGVLSFVFGRKG